MEEDCCCGKYTIVDKVPFQVNDYVHEPVDLEGGNFCGPRINHDIRDYKAEIERLKEEKNKILQNTQQLKQRIKELEEISKQDKSTIKLLTKEKLESYEDHRKTIANINNLKAED